MNKNLGISLGVIIVILVFGGLYLSQKKETVMVKATPETVMEKETTDSMMKIENKKYFEYSDPSTLEVKGSKKVLFFYANWCPTCIPVDREFKAKLDKIPEDVSIIRVNYNDSDTDKNEEDLARKYEITYQHTFVQINDNGDVVTKWNGGGLDELISKLK